MDTDLLRLRAWPFGGPDTDVPYTHPTYQNILDPTAGMMNEWTYVPDPGTGRHTGADFSTRKWTIGATILITICLIYWTQKETQH